MWQDIDFGGAFDSVGEVHGSTCRFEMDSSKMFKLLLMEEILLTSWYGKYPIIYRVLCISGGAGFLPSTVSFKYSFVASPRENPYEWLWNVNSTWSKPRHLVRRLAMLLPFEVDVMRPIVSGVLQENDQARYGKDLVTSGVSSEEVDILGCVVVLLRCSAIHPVMHLMEKKHVYLQIVSLHIDTHCNYFLRDINFSVSIIYCEHFPRLKSRWMMIQRDFHASKDLDWRRKVEYSILNKWHVHQTIGALRCLFWIAARLQVARYMILICILSLKLTIKFTTFQSKLLFFLFSGDEILRSTQRCGSILHGPDAHLVKKRWVFVGWENSRRLDATKMITFFFV